MSTSTRVFLSLMAIMLAVVVVYYGVLADRGTVPASSRASDVGEEDVALVEESISRSTPAQQEQPRLAGQPRVDLSTPPASRLGVNEPAALDDVEIRERDDAADELLDDSDVEPDEPVRPSGESEETPIGEDAPPEVNQAEGDDSDEEHSESDPDDDAADDSEEPQPQPEPEPKPTPEPARYTSYTVKEGDTMSSIAQEWFGDAGKWELIAKANPLVDPAKLKIGQVLRLPPRDTERDEIDATAVVYTVRSGDTLSKIALAYYGEERHWQLIYDANKPTIGTDPNNLKVGMKLTIPPAP